MDWLRRLMFGRYGMDQLNFAMLILSCVLLVVARVGRWWILTLLCYVLLVLCYLRLFSRNLAKRSQENQRFLRYWWPLSQRLNRMAASARDVRTHCHYHCPRCKQKIRVPRGRGKISITCPRCGEQFVKKT